MESNTTTRKRFNFYGKSEQRAIKILKKSKRIKWRRIKVFGYTAAVALFLIVFNFFFFPDFDEDLSVVRPAEVHSSNALPVKSPRPNHPQEVPPKRYSTDALSSKPKAKFKLNEQVTNYVLNHNLLYQ